MTTHPLQNRPLDHFCPLENHFELPPAELHTNILKNFIDILFVEGGTKILLLHSLRGELFRE